MSQHDPLPEHLSMIESQLLESKIKPLSETQDNAIRKDLSSPVIQQPHKRSETLWTVLLFLCAAAALLLVIGLNSAQQSVEIRQAATRFAQESAATFKTNYRVAGLFYSRKDPKDPGFVVLENRESGKQDIFRVGSRLGDWTITGLSEKTISLSDDDGKVFEARIEADATSKTKGSENPGSIAMNLGLQKLGQNTTFGALISMIPDVNSKELAMELREEFLGLLGPILEVLSSLDWDTLIAEDGKTVDLDALLEFLQDWKDTEASDKKFLIEAVQGIFEIYRGNDSVGASLLENAMSKHPDLRNFAVKVGGLAWEGMYEMNIIGEGSSIYSKEDLIVEMANIKPEDVNEEMYLTVFLNSTLRTLQPAPVETRHEDEADLLDAMFDAMNGDINPEDHTVQFNHPAIWWVYFTHKEQLFREGKLDSDAAGRLVAQLHVAAQRYPDNAIFATTLGAFQILRKQEAKGIATWEGIPQDAVWNEYIFEQIEVGVRHSMNNSRSYVSNSAGILLPHAMIFRNATNHIRELYTTVNAGQALEAFHTFTIANQTAQRLIDHNGTIILNLIGISMVNSTSETSMKLAKQFGFDDVMLSSRRNLAEARYLNYVFQYATPYEGGYRIAYAEMLLNPVDYKIMWDALKTEGLNTGLLQRNRKRLEMILLAGPDEYPELCNLQAKNYLKAQAAFDRGEYQEALVAAEAQMKEARHLWAFKIYYKIVMDDLAR